MSLRRALFAGVMALSVGTASAADPLMLGSQSGAAGFSWAGSYLGLYTGWLFTPLGTVDRIGGQAGYNFVRGRFLIGIEGHGGAIFTVGPGAAEVELSARLGAILRSRFLLYGEAGIGMVADQGTYTFGGGVEVAVGDSFSLFAEAKRFGTFASGCCNNTVQLGLNFHP
jgi:hypothetical protein